MTNPNGAHQSRTLIQKHREQQRITPITLPLLYFIAWICCFTITVTCAFTINNGHAFVVSHQQRKKNVLPFFAKSVFTLGIVNTSRRSRSSCNALQSSSENNIELDSNSTSIDNKNKNEKETLEEALAKLTQTKSSLLGTKSIGIDYGLVRTGIAITVGYEPQPMTILDDYNTNNSTNNTILCQQIIQIIESEKPEQIVLGLPFHKNGTVAEQTLLTRQFANQLVCAVYAHFGPGALPIYLWDERYTSKEAAARALSINPNANLFKELDADAAGLILEYFYADDGVGAEQVLLPEEGTELREMVERAWDKRKGEIEKKWEDYRLERERGLNAREMAMERSRIFEEKLAAERGDNGSAAAGGGGGKKKKKKKKKKKMNNNLLKSNNSEGGKGKGNKWIVL